MTPVCRNRVQKSQGPGFRGRQYSRPPICRALSASAPQNPHTQVLSQSCEEAGGGSAPMRGPFDPSAAVVPRHRKDLELDLLQGLPGRSLLDSIPTDLGQRSALGGVH